MILFKMLSRGVICEINGCISTGKEVRNHWYTHQYWSTHWFILINTLIYTHDNGVWTVCVFVYVCVFVFFRRMFITPARQQETAEPSRSTRPPSCCSKTGTNTSAESSGQSHHRRRVQLSHTTEEEYVVRSSCSLWSLYTWEAAGCKLDETWAYWTHSAAPKCIAPFRLPDVEGQLRGKTRELTYITWNTFSTKIFSNFSSP